MNLFRKEQSLTKSCSKEIAALSKQEAVFQKQASKEPAQWKAALAAKVPDTIYTGLQAAFRKAFTVVFEKGASVIDKTYDRNGLIQNHQVQDYAVKLKKSRRELKHMRKMAQKSNFMNAAVTTVEGVGLGALGIGMPDIVVFIGFLLRGACECAAHYGFDSGAPKERLLILRMMEAALVKKDDWNRVNAEVDALLTSADIPSEEELHEQIRRTSDAFAVDMLLLKFVQGLPLVGIVGGLGNPVYYNRIMRYVQVKYYKRYLLGMMGE